VETPSGGIIKYNLRDFLADLRAGLLRQINKSSSGAWKDLRGKCRTPICVGDVYLLLHALFGQGLPPLLLATAKSERIRGHWHVEHYILRKRALWCGRATRNCAGAEKKLALTPSMPETPS
jgi:tetraacyldisaccharide 4'-kinase